MTTEIASKKTRINFQVSSEHKLLLERAASVRGQSLSEFAISNLLPLAEKTLDQAERTQLSNRDRDLFLDMLESPDEPNDALRRAAEHYREQCG